MKRFYTALFTPAEEGGFIVTFPSIPLAMTQGDSIEEAYENAFDVLGLALQDEEGNFIYPEQIDLSELDIPNDVFIVTIQFDEIEYLKKYVHIK